MHRTKIASPLAALLALALSLSACSSPSSTGAGGDDGYVNGATITASIAADPGDLNPLTHLYFTTEQVSTYVYDKIVAVDEGGRVVPNLATSWEFDGTTAVFQMTDGVTFSDGTALTPEIVADNLNWHLDPDNASVRLGFAVPDTGYSATFDNDAGTVTLVLDEPNATLLQTLNELPIVSPAALADPTSISAASGGTGPFVVSSVNPGSEYVLAVREDYTWGPDGATTDVEGFPASVILKVVNDESTAATMLTTGELNLARLTDADAIARLASSGYTEAQNEQITGQYWINHGAGRAGADTEFRLALAQSLDVEALVTVRTGGAGSRLTSMTVTAPTMCAAYDPVSVGAPSADVEAANAALDVLGYTRGDDNIRTAPDGTDFTLKLLNFSDTGPLAQAAVELMRDTWQEQLGIEVELVAGDSATQFALMFGGGDWDVASLAFNFGIPSQMTPYVAGGSNFAQIDNSDYVSYSTEALSTVDSTSACELWEQADAALYRNADIIPVSQTPVITYGNGALSDQIVSPTSLRAVITD